MATKKLMSYDGLTEYDALIKAEITKGDSSALESAKSYTDTAVSGKADSNHIHNDLYYTETEIDTKISEVNTSIESITNGSVTVAKADEANHAASADTSTSATTAESAEKATQDASGNVITTTYETKTDASAKLAEAKEYTDTKTSDFITSTIADNKISTHNTSTSAHSDIRDLIDGLTTRLNVLADSDDTTLDQLSEIVAYIKANKNLIDSITTDKVNVADIVDNLTTNASNKPLSAAQGVELKALIDNKSVDLPTDFELITVDDIDMICGSSITVVSFDDEVIF